MTGYKQDPVPATVPFWPKPLSIFGLPAVTTFIKSSRVFTIPPIQPPLRLMLADTPFPHGSGARQSTLRPRVAVLLPHDAFQEPAAHPAEWSAALNSKGSERPCIRSGLATFLHGAFTAHSDLVVDIWHHMVRAA